MHCVSSADRAGEDKAPKEERKMNGGCASRGKILSEEHKTENKMDRRKQESRKKEKKKKIRDKKGGNQIQGLYLRLERLAEGER